MAGKAVPNMKGVRVFPPAPKGSMRSLRARQTWRGMEYRSVLILERSLGQRRCGSSACDGTRILSTWSPGLLLPMSRPSPFSRVSGCRRLYPAGSS